MAFMVPLVKNHYDIYNTRSSFSDHDNGYMMGSSNNQISRRVRTVSQSSQSSNNNDNNNNSNNSNKKTNNTTGNSQIVLNGVVLLNGRSKSKPKVVLSSANCSKGQTKTIQVQQSQRNNKNGEQKTSPVKRTPSSPSYSSTQSMNQSTRSFPHVKRTVRNPMTNRVYSYSVSIPEYVAEEDEEELARLALEESLEQCESPTLDQVMIFSTSAPAGTGSIENGIIDIVDEDDFIRCTGARLPPTIRTQTNKSRRNKSFPPSSSSIDDKCVASSINDDSVESETSTKYENSSNSREYMELLQKFILHLKMLKLKRIFTNTKNSNSKECSRQRNRSSTLDDSINL